MSEPTSPADITLHIGCPKTGTTGLQRSLSVARPELRRLGVEYPGPDRNHHRAARALTGFADREGIPNPPAKAWDDLVRRTTGAVGKRVIISSEYFCEADAATVQRVVAELGPPIRVVLTLRPLAKVLASHWQQYMQGAHRPSFEKWLESVLRGGKLTPSFWRRQRHDEIVSKWADAVGDENVTVVCLSHPDHNWLYRRFEEIAGLPSNTLAPADIENRSLSWPEAELLRQVNLRYRERGEWSPEMYNRVISLGVALPFKTDAFDASLPRVVTPQWALDAAVEIETEMIGAIAARQVRVVGDLNELARPEEAPEGPTKPSPLPAARSAEALLLAVNAAREFGRAEGRAQAEKAAAGKKPPPVSDEVRQLSRRIARAIRFRLRGRAIARQPSGARPPRQP